MIEENNYPPDPLMRNPYFVGPPIKNPNQFFDRQELIDRFKNIQNQQVCIIGVRRIGKTSLLYQIAQAYNQPEHKIPLMISLQGLREVERMGRALYQTIERAAKDHVIVQKFLEKHEPDTFLTVLADWGVFCEEFSLESLLLLDEAEQLSILSEEQLVELKRLTNVGFSALSLIVTGSRFLRKLGPVEDRFLLDFQQLTLEVLPEQNIQALLSQNNKVWVSMDNQQEIAHKSGRHPYFAQYIAYSLFWEGRLNELSQYPESLVLKNGLPEIIEDEFRRLSPLEQRIMFQLQFETFLSLSALEKALKVPKAALETPVSELKELSLIRVCNGSYALGNIFWKKYLEYLETDPDLLDLNSKPPQPTSDPPTNEVIFISHHVADDSVRDRLRVHLKPANIDVRDSSSILPGTDTQIGFEAQINKAQTILLLLSAEYLADKEKIHERAAIKSLKDRGKRIIPILVRACLWEEEFGAIVILPTDKEPINNRIDLDSVLLAIVREILRRE